MPRKLILSLAVTMFFSLVSHVQAELLISEFVSDPDSGSEWVELWNNSSEEIDLSLWSWTEMASPGGETEHESAHKSLTGSIAPGGVYVFEMNSALNNGGDSIGLYEGAGEKDRVTFGTVGAHSQDIESPSKGKSGALIAGTWKTDQEPTKNISNPSSSSTPPSDDEEDDTQGGGNKTSTTAKTSTTSEKKYPIKINITAEKVAHVGIPFSFEGTGTGESGGALSRGRYFWNFGDGDFREVRASVREKFTHTYFYPGEYTVVFDYYADSFTEDPVASDEMIIKVIDPEIVISGVGSADDFFIEITNKTDSNADISNWMLLSAYRIFTFPRNTHIGSNKKMIIAPTLSRFTEADEATLRLMTPAREIVHSYAGSTVPSSQENNISNANSVSMSEVGASDSNEDTGRASLSALALGGSQSDPSKPRSPTPWVGFSGLVFLLGGAVIAVRFIRRKPSMDTPGEDFEILDE